MVFFKNLRLHAKLLTGEQEIGPMTQFASTCNDCLLTLWGLLKLR